MIAPVVYAAHPLTTYGTPREASCLRRVATLLPGVELIDPARRYSSDEGWRRAWPRVLRQLSGLVIFTAADGTIGAGCLREIGDAWAARLPVALLHRRRLYEVGALVVAETQLRSPRRLATVVPGRPYAPGELAEAIRTRRRPA